MKSLSVEQIQQHIYLYIQENVEKRTMPFIEEKCISVTPEVKLSDLAAWRCWSLVPERSIANYRERSQAAAAVITAPPRKHAKVETPRPVPQKNASHYPWARACFLEPGEACCEYCWRDGRVSLAYRGRTDGTCDARRRGEGWRILNLGVTGSDAAKGTALLIPHG